MVRLSDDLEELSETELRVPSPSVGDARGDSIDPTRVNEIVVHWFLLGSRTSFQPSLWARFLPNAPQAGVGQAVVAAPQTRSTAAKRDP
jgi:hypothetical protein